MPDFKKLPTVNGTAVALADHTHLVVTPDQVTGLKVWLKADSLNLADGAAVTTWSDSSGNGLDATQASAGKKPLYKTSVVNGRPVVRFDGTDDTMACPAFSSVLTVPYTIFVVCQMNLTAIAENKYITGSGTPGNGGADGDADHGVVIARNADKTFGLYNGAGFGGGASNAWVIIQATFNGAASEIQVNAATTSGDAGSGSLGRLSLASNRDIGAYAAVDIAELAIYDPTPTTAELTALRAGLTAKYSTTNSAFAWLTKWGTD